MAVSIDPSEVRRSGISVTLPPEGVRRRARLKAVLIGCLGGAGLIAFSFGAFSFFSGLADPRARAPRTMPIAAKMPDLKDGIPALASEDAAGATSQAASFNLPRPPSPEPKIAQSQAPLAQAEPLRSATFPSVPVVAEAAQDTRSEVETGSVGRSPKGVPAIQNVAIIADTPRTVALVQPARAETIKAKAGQPNASGSLPIASKALETKSPESKPQRDLDTAVHEARKSAPKASRVVAQAKPHAARTVADAAPAQEQPAARSTDDGDVIGAIPGGNQIRAGLKAIGGVFGGSDAE